MTIFVSVPCPECGGPIEYEVEEIPSPFRGLAPSWHARDLDRACACQIGDYSPDISDEDAWAEGWARLDKEAIRLAREQRAA